MTMTFSLCPPFIQQGFLYVNKRKQHPSFLIKPAIASNTFDISHHWRCGASADCSLAAGEG